MVDIKVLVKNTLCLYHLVLEKHQHGLGWNGKIEEACSLYADGEGGRASWENPAEDIDEQSVMSFSSQSCLLITY